MINVEKVFRSNTKFRVSASAVKELESFIEAYLDGFANRAETIAKGKGKKTIQADDVIQAWGARGD